MIDLNLLVPGFGTGNPHATRALWDRTIHPLSGNPLIFLFISSSLIPKARMGLHPRGWEPGVNSTLQKLTSFGPGSKALAWIFAYSFPVGLNTESAKSS